MRCIHGRKATFTLLLSSFLVVAAGSRSTWAQSEASPKTILGEAEINANDVYVRSGDSLNHYTIIKLKAGDRVTVVGERGEWYEILPPEGAFSLVSGDYIDSKDDQTGVVNGANVRVRAGSLINENKYTVQTLLSKGDEVTILGRNPDGFLRIKPPKGATLWVNKTYANMGGSGTVSNPVTATQASDNAPGSGSASPPVTTMVASTTESVEKPVEQAPAAIMPSSPKTSKPAISNEAYDAQQRKLAELDNSLMKEYAKPAADRNFDSYLTQYRSLLADAKDEFSQQYAQRRIDEIQLAAEAASSINHWKKIDEIAEAKRREFRTARAAIPESAPAAPAIEAKGELRVSALFPPGSDPERYRLIDPTSSGERTIAYVEIPQGSGVNVDSFLNKYVGVRALERRVQTGGVNPIPIYIADDLVLLEPPTGTSSIQAVPGAAPSMPQTIQPNP